jgi:diadenosine tetraphosphatase ApaH/serine/threonine PP2A family protein phosphatase
MARIALISDIHGNLEAFESALVEVRAARADKIVCLGDVVGYGPDPGPCLDLVAKLRIPTVIGNHDEAALSPTVPPDFNEPATQSLLYTRHVLTDAQKQIIRSWPQRLDFAGVAFTHGSFAKNRWDYVVTPQTAADAFVGMEGRLGAVGHTHVPSVFSSPLDQPPGLPALCVLVVAGEPVSLSRGQRYLVNPGSIGQPRDRNPGASWGLLDTTRSVFSIHRVAYDIDAVEAKIRAAGLPDFLSDRLRVGA